MLDKLMKPGPKAYIFKQFFAQHSSNCSSNVQDLFKIHLRQQMFKIYPSNIQYPFNFYSRSV